jgi:hypothetical protein
MTITFENDNDIIVYALENVISYARRNQQVFLAQCIWWLASIIGLEQGLLIHIDKLAQRSNNRQQTESSLRQEVPEPGQPIHQVHPDRVLQVTGARAVSSVPRDRTEDQRLDQILDSAERVIQESFQDRKTFQQNRVNPLPTTKAQLKKARKAKNLQNPRDKLETDRQERLRQIRIQVIKRLAKDD